MIRQPIANPIDRMIFSIERISYFAASVLAVIGLILGFAVPCTISEVADGQSLFQNLIWILAASLATLHLWLSPDKSRRLTRFMSRRWISIAIVSVAMMLSAVTLATNVVGPAANFRHSLNALWAWFQLVMMTWTLLLLQLPALDEEHGTTRLQRNLFWLCCTTVAILSLHGLYQVFVSFPEDLAHYRRSPDEVIQMSGINAPPGSAARMLFESRLFDRAPTATFALTNSLAIVLAIVALLLIGQIRVDGWKDRLRSVSLALIFLVPIFACLLYTKSRTAWLAFLIGLLILFCMRILNNKSLVLSRYWWVGLVSACGLIVVFTLLVYWWDPLIISESFRSLFFRASYWTTTLAIVADHPWLGVGPGNFQDYFTQYKARLASESVADPHSLWFETLAVGGPFAFIGLIVSCLSLLATRGFRPTSNLDVTDNEKVEKLAEISQSKLRSFSDWLDDLRWAHLFQGLANPVIVGVLLSCWLLWLTNGVAGLPPDPLVYMALIPLGLLIGALNSFLPVVSILRLDRQVLVPAFVSMLLCLSFAGGWMTPGVTNFFGVLVAWLLVEHFSTSATATSNKKSVNGSKLGSMPMIAMLIILLIGGVFYVTTWRPVRATERAMLELQSSRSPPTLEALFQLADIDPSNPKLWRLAAATSHTQVVTQAIANRGKLEAASLEKFRMASEKYVACDKQNWESSTQQGHWAMDLAAFDRSWLKVAERGYRRAIDRYPSDVEVLLQAALASFLHGEYQVAREILSEAESIDEQSPHLDRKLAAGLVYCSRLLADSTLQRNNAWQRDQLDDATQTVAATNFEFFLEFRDEIRRSGGWLVAEPVAVKLRKQLDILP